ncbi:hypothetical protein Tco_0160651, partial [Tanacetum coccineum]
GAHFSGVGRVLPRQGTVIPPPPPCTHSSDVVKLKKREKVLMRQLESQHEIGGGSGSGRLEDDEQGHDEDDGEDGEDKDDCYEMLGKYIYAILCLKCILATLM